MNDFHDRRAVPGWFWAVAVLALLFELFICYGYLADVSRSPETIATLPLDERMMTEARPWWIYAAYGFAAWGGLLGVVLLLMRRRHAQVLLLISLIGMIVQFAGVLLVREIRDVSPPNAFTIPIIVTVIAYGIWHFSRYARKRGWLR